MKSEPKAYWVFLAWVLLLPFLDQISLRAANTKADATQAQEVIPIQDFEISNDGSKETDAIPKSEANVDADAEPDPNKEPDDQLPALSADPIDLLGKVNGLAKAKKFKSVIKALSSHEDVVVTDARLLNIYVEALIHAKKQKWKVVLKFAKVLARKKRKSSLANYAQGLYYVNKKKPDLKKALKYLSKAKSSKKPYPGVGTQYYIVLLKKYWTILLIVIAIPLLIIVKISKKKKADAKIDIDISLDVDAETTKKEDVGDNLKIESKIEDSISKGQAKEKNDDQEVATPSKQVEQKKAQVVKPLEIETAKKENAVAIPTQQEKISENIPPQIQTPAISEEVANIIQTTPVQPTEAVKTNIEIEPPPQIPTVETHQPLDLEQNSTQAVDSHPNYARKLTETVRQDVVVDSSELDATWNRLCQKALQKTIPQDYSKNRKSSSMYGAPPSVDPSPAVNNYGSPIEPKIDLNVTIDLSEESLRDDLVGKLKMLAISDSELRTLFSQKNPAHIPHLIEYVLTRPEPLRLSFVARELGHYVDLAIIDTLASLLYHEDNRVILGALQGLEITKSSEAVLHICPFLKSDTPVLAQAARNALANFGAVKILTAFINLPSHSDDKIKIAGIFVLSRMKGKQVEELLISMLDDEVLDIRKTVLLAMSYQKNPIYIEPLRTFFRTAKDEDKTLSRKAIVYLQGFVPRKSPKQSD